MLGKVVRNCYFVVKTLNMVLKRNLKCVHVSSLEKVVRKKFLINIGNSHFIPHPLCVGQVTLAEAVAPGVPANSSNVKTARRDNWQAREDRMLQR